MKLVPIEAMEEIIISQQEVISILNQRLMALEKEVFKSVELSYGMQINENFAKQLNILRTKSQEIGVAKL